MASQQCSNCVHKRNVPGDAHIACVQPAIKKEEFKILMGLMLGNVNVIATDTGLSFNDYGVKNGWCSFPSNFDPTWMEGTCKLKEEIPQ